MEMSVLIKKYCENVRLVVLKVPINFDFEKFQGNMKDKEVQIFPYTYKNNTKFHFVSIS